MEEEEIDQVQKEGSDQVQGEGSKQEIDCIKLWFATHFNIKKNQWVDELSKEIYDQIIQLSFQAQGEMTIDEIFDQVLKPKSSNLQGFDHGPKPRTSKVARLTALYKMEAAEAKKRAEEVDKGNKKLLEIIEILETRPNGVVAQMLETLRHRMNAIEIGFYRANNSNSEDTSSSGNVLGK